MCAEDFYRNLFCFLFLISPRRTSLSSLNTSLKKIIIKQCKYIHRKVILTHNTSRHLILTACQTSLSFVGNNLKEVVKKAWRGAIDYKPK